MTRTSPGRRLAVGGLAATTAMAGLALLAGPAAAAGETTRLSLTPPTGTAAAGSCLVYTLQPLDTTGVASTDSATATVRIAESPNAATQDVDFCTVPGVTSTPYSRPVTTTGPTGSAAQPNKARYVQTAGVGIIPSVQNVYTVGPSVTPNPNKASSQATGDTPDSADMQVNMNGDNNPSGVDLASFPFAGGQPIKFGITALTAGAATLNAFLDKTGGTADAADPAEPASEMRTATFTAGGLPGSQTAADAAGSVDAEPETGSAQLGSLQRFDTVVKNAAGQTLFGVTPQLRVTSGANAAAADQLRADCGETNNDGVSSCVFQGAKTGTDNLVVFVQRTGGTTGVDANEVRDDITRTTTPAAVDRTQARYLTLTPSAVTTVSGSAQSFVSKVTSVTGAPVRQASLSVSEDGPGAFTTGSGGSTIVVVTDEEGLATATVRTVAGEQGTQKLVATILDPATTQCGQLSGAGTGATTTTPAGTCTATATHTVLASSPSPSPSVSPSATTSPSASPRPSASATPTLSMSPSPSSSPTPVTVAPSIRLERSTITSQESVGVSATTFPGAIVELYAYSRPSTTYVVVRRGVATQDGTISFQVGPSGNTRLFVRTKRADGTGSQDSASVVLTVRTSINLKVTRTGTRTYRFTGSTLPKRVNQLVTVFYQASGGNRVIAARARVSSTGTYNVTRTFTGGGTFTLFTATGTDINNAGNTSNSVRAVIR